MLAVLFMTLRFQIHMQM